MKESNVQFAAVSTITTAVTPLAACLSHSWIVGDLLTIGNSLNSKEAEMKYSTLPQIRALFAMKLIGRMCGTLMLPLLLGMVMGTPLLCAQQINAPSDLNQQTSQLLLRRIDQLEEE